MRGGRYEGLKTPADQPGQKNPKPRIIRLCLSGFQRLTLTMSNNGLKRRTLSQSPRRRILPIP